MLMSSQEYALSRVKDALATTKGDVSEAQRMLIHWLEKDKSLLVGLVGPHLKSIVLHAVTHIDKLEHATNTKRPTQMKVEEDKEGLGMSLLENVAKLNEETFGRLSEQSGKPTKASKEHVKAIMQIAKKVTDK